MRINKLSGLLVVLLFALAAETAMAQSTIFNIPTTDTVSKGKGYFEFDYLPQMPKPEGADRLQIFNPRLVVGVGGNVEVGANFASIHTPGRTNAFFQPNIKWKFANSDNEGLAGAVGGILFTPINHRTGVDTYGLVYGNFSKKVKKGNYGPALRPVHMASCPVAATGWVRRQGRLWDTNSQSIPEPVSLQTGSVARMASAISLLERHSHFPQMDC